MGGDLPLLVTRLQEADARRQGLARQHAALGDGPIVSRFDWRAVERQARRTLKDWRALLSRHVVEARPLLRQLLVEPIRFTPFRDGARRGYRFEGYAGIGGLLEGMVDVIGLASPRGFAPSRKPGFAPSV